MLPKFLFISPRKLYRLQTLSRLRLIDLLGKLLPRSVGRGEGKSVYGNFPSKQFLRDAVIAQVHEANLVTGGVDL
ncbi:MAG: hypothetical protein JO235_14595 [Chroococcidiopsidaceae cyanobacterium CP_BM_RX_35]|nr:hypothetical protein [Chroococcidiopsidaceae cyanobacterium CP_BM_RX_35]